MTPVRQRNAHLTVELLEARDLLAASIPVQSHPGNAQTAALLGLDVVRNDSQYQHLNGHGLSVVVLDTGIDRDHPFFGPDADRNGVADRIVYQWDFANKDADATDRSGHGSHVTSLIASQNASTTGVASDVDIIALKVFADSGAGKFVDIEKALQWVVANGAKYNVAAVNLSLGDGKNWTTATTQNNLGDELASLAAQNIVVVAAAGNSFSRFTRTPGVAYPAADPNAIAVGATWPGDFGGPFTNAGATETTTDLDRITAYSQRSAALTDVFAPGAMLAGASATGGMTEMSGTSQATPFVTGAAVLAQQLALEHLGRRLTPGEFLRLMQHSGVTVVDGDDEQDSVTNTGATFKRLDIKNLLDLIQQLPRDWNGNQPLPAFNFAPRLVRNTGVTLDEGASITLTDKHLRAFDADDTTAQMQYRLTRTPTNGNLLFGNQILRVGDSFTQDDLNRGRVRYQHDGSDTISDTIGFVLTDSGHNISTEMTLTCTIRAIDDAPVVTTSQPTIAAGTQGTSIAELLGGTSSERGIAVVGLGNAMDGTWQYSLDGGRTWKNFGAVYRSRSRLLSENDRVRFVPKPYFRGPAKMTFHTWNRRTGTNGGTVNLLSPNAIGGTTPFSATSQTATWTE